MKARRAGPPSSGIKSWSGTWFHRPLLQDEITTLRVKLTPQFAPAEERVDGLTADVRIADLKQVIAMQLSLSPRVKLRLRSWGSDLNDSATLRESLLIDDGLVELLITPRSPEECADLVQSNPPAVLRIKPMMGIGEQMIVLSGLRANTTIGTLKSMLVEQRLLEEWPQETIEKGRILFHPHIISWELLLTNSVLPDASTIVDCQLMRDDILYLAPEEEKPEPREERSRKDKKGAKGAKGKAGAKKKK